MKSYNKALLLICSSVIVAINADPRVYLQNDYRSSLLYSMNGNELPIHTNTRVPLGDANAISYLLIKTTSFNAQYKNIIDKIAQIKNEYRDHLNHNAIIVILDTRNLFEWKFAIQWEPTLQRQEDIPIEKIAAFFRLATTAEHVCRYITNDKIFGPEYAHMVIAIQNTHYTTATNNGYQNLWHQLLMKINEVASPIINSPNNVKKTAIDSLKTTIKLLYERLHLYKNANLI